jgi:hypothetical protein
MLSRAALAAVLVALLAAASGILDAFALIR